MATGLAEVREEPFGRLSGQAGRPARSGVWWGLALVGQFVFVFAVVALSGPGRIDIDDGQLRFDVAQSLVDHGDSAIRDPNLTFAVFPGRNGQRYSNVRLPQSAAGVVAIWLADATGPVTEARRHFFFALTSAFACAALAVTYTLWFRSLGLAPFAALGWATAGIFCTPAWFYGTSVFDDILGSAASVMAVTTVSLTRQKRPWLGAAAAGLLLGLAFNCKQPLGIVVLPVLAAGYDSQAKLATRPGRIGVVLAGLTLGIGFCKAYDLYKFPPEMAAVHAEMLKKWGPVWTANPLPGLLGLTISPGAGCIWYCPTLVLSFCGLAAWYRSRRLFGLSMLTVCVVYLLFHSFLTIFKGDVAWGPRYFTPVFALLWVFVPAAAARIRPRLVAGVLALGLIVQLLALSVDQHRLYVQRGLWSGFYFTDPWLYGEPACAHLVNRPMEIIAMLSPGHPPAQSYTPSRLPTYCPPIVERFPGGRQAIYRYSILSSFRPWWISQQHLAPGERPVALWPTFWLLFGTMLGGLALTAVGCRGCRWRLFEGGGEAWVDPDRQAFRLPDRKSACAVV